MPSKNLVTINGRNKIFYDTVKSKDLSTNPVIQKVLEGKNYNPRRLTTTMKPQAINNLIPT